MSGRQRGNAGETIVESLVSMLVVSLVFVFLVNAVITTANVNASVKDVDSSYDKSSARYLTQADVAVDGTSVTVNVYEVSSDDGDATYDYYEKDA